MSGPKHLWSGDWQQESAAVSEDLASRRVKPSDRQPTVSPTPTPTPTPSTPARRRAAPARKRPGLRRALPIVLVAVLLLAAGAWGLTALLGSSGPKGSTTAAGSFGSPAATVPTVPPAATVPTVPPAATTATTATTASAPSRPVDWLGMEIETVAPGAAVIDTVSYGSPGQLAGLEPGDVIVEINNQPIHGAGDIAAAIRGLSAGDVVQMQVSNGSALFNTEVTLAAPPSLYP